jgi:hypothetical protein
MSLILDGSNGLSDVDGTAATPAIRGTDANTGIFFPAADTIAFSEGGVESMRIDSSGNVGIGTTTPTFATGTGLQVKGAGFTSVRITGASATGIDFSQDASANGYMYNRDNAALIYGTNNTERMRIDSSGNLLVGATSAVVQTGEKFSLLNAAGMGAGIKVGAESNIPLSLWNTGTTGTRKQISFYDSAAGGVRGEITTNGTATTYGTSSDYRLKENITPMTGALATVSALKPVTYKWKTDGSNGQGFIAHELQAVVPDCVTGEKDAVDADGNPQYQGIDTSFLVATLTAAIQELKSDLDSTKTLLANAISTVDAQAARIAALENPPVESATNE